MRIEKALAVPIRGGFFNDDLSAIRAGARRDGFTYEGAPLTPGFDSIRQPSEAASIVLLLDNGQCVAGDAMSVEYAAAGGRRGRFRHQEQIPHLLEICDFLQGRTVERFLSMCETLESQPFHPGLHRPAAFYAASQALLQARALERGLTAAEAVAEELGVSVSEVPIPVYVQCGEDRRHNVDKAIIKRVPVLPHGLINDIETTLGWKGELLLEYVGWIVTRIRKYGEAGYNPEILIDVYGLLGQIFGPDHEAMADYVARLGEQARPYALCLETPVLMESRQAQIEAFGSLRRALQARGSAVLLIVDEWANSLEDIRVFVRSEVTDMVNVKTPDLGALSNSARAVLECWAGGVRPILGGSCTDTDLSARVVAQVALATRPAWVLARPGMGIDEGLQIVDNEMVRTLAVIQARRQAPALSQVSGRAL